jgi:glycerophosphoryl diester phosphodiesterase
MDKSRLIVAHRGNSAQAPENTLAAFRQAIDIGADYIELDVHLSADGVPIVVHDSELHRTTNAPTGSFVKTMTLAQLKELNAGSWFSEKYAQETLPTLEEVLKLDFKKTNLFIEVKMEDAFEKRPSPDGWERKLVKAVVDLLQRVKVPYKIVLGSFSPTVVDELFLQAKGYECFALADNLESLEAFLQQGRRRLSLFYQLITPELMQALNDQQAEVWVFTVNNPERAQYLYSLGVRGVITDDPVCLRRAILENHRGTEITEKERDHREK